MLKVVHDEAKPNEVSGSVLDEIVGEAARQRGRCSRSPWEGRAHGIGGHHIDSNVLRHGKETAVHIASSDSTQARSVCQ